MRSAVLLAALMTCLPPQVLAQPPAPPPAPPPVWNPAACPFLDSLDLTKFEPQVVPDKAVQRADELIRRERLNLSPPERFSAGRIVAVYEFPSLKRAYTVLAAFRSPDGGWLVRAAGPSISLRRGRVVPPALAGRINAAIANPCLFSEPAMAPRNWPTLSGDTALCTFGSNTLINLDLPPAAPRRVFHECEKRGAAGALYDLLAEAAYGPYD